MNNTNQFEVGTLISFIGIYNKKIRFKVGRKFLIVDEIEHI